MAYAEQMEASFGKEKLRAKTVSSLSVVAQISEHFSGSSTVAAFSVFQCKYRCGWWLPFYWHTNRYSMRFLHPLVDVI